MPTSLSENLGVRIGQLIERYGLSATLTTFGTTSYDPATGAAVKGDPAGHAVKVTPPQPLEDDAQNETQTLQSRARVFVAADGLGLVPRTGCVLTLDGRDWAVVRVDTYLLDDAPALYELRVQG